MRTARFPPAEKGTGQLSARPCPTAREQGLEPLPRPLFERSPPRPTTPSAAAPRTDAASQQPTFWGGGGGFRGEPSSGSEGLCLSRACHGLSPAVSRGSGPGKGGEGGSEHPVPSVLFGPRHRGRCALARPGLGLWSCGREAALGPCAPVGKGEQRHGPLLLCTSRGTEQPRPPRPCLAPVPGGHRRAVTAAQPRSHRGVPPAQHPEPRRPGSAQTHRGAAGGSRGSSGAGRGTSSALGAGGPPRHSSGTPGLCSPRPGRGAGPAGAARQHLRAAASAREEVGDSSSPPRAAGGIGERASPGFLPVLGKRSPQPATGTGGGTRGGGGGAGGGPSWAGGGGPGASRPRSPLVLPRAKGFAKRPARGARVRAGRGAELPEPPPGRVRAPGLPRGKGLTPAWGRLCRGLLLGTGGAEPGQAEGEGAPCAPHQLLGVPPSAPQSLTASAAGARGEPGLGGHPRRQPPPPPAPRGAAGAEAEPPRPFWLPLGCRCCGLPVASWDVVDKPCHAPSPPPPNF